MYFTVNGQYDRCRPENIQCHFHASQAEIIILVECIIYFVALYLLLVYMGNSCCFIYPQMLMCILDKEVMGGSNIFTSSMIGIQAC